MSGYIKINFLETKTDKKAKTTKFPQMYSYHAKYPRWKLASLSNLLLTDFLVKH